MKDILIAKGYLKYQAEEIESIFNKYSKESTASDVKVITESDWANLALAIIEWTEDYVDARVYTRD